MGDPQQAPLCSGPLGEQFPLNPYWAAVRGYVGSDGVARGVPDDVQWQLRRGFSLAIPDPLTVSFVARFLTPSAIEIGPGTGYWSWLLEQLGVSVVAIDRAPIDRVTDNSCHSPMDYHTGDLLGRLRSTFHPVLPGGPEALEQYPDRVLFLCWPPYRSSMAVECLLRYAGSRLVYLGEGWGNSCANRAFFDRLERMWRPVATHTPVRWEKLYDAVTVYERA